MTDSLFKFSLTLLFWIVLAAVLIAIVLGAMGMPWLYLALPALVLLTIFIGLVVLTIGGSTLIYFWGKRYMSKE